MKENQTKPNPFSSRFDGLQVPPAPARVAILDKACCCSTFLLSSFHFPYLDCEFLGEEMLYIHFRVAYASRGKACPVSKRTDRWV